MAAISDSAMTGSSIVNTAPPTSAVAGRDLAAVLADDAVAHRQAEAGALADFAGREERIEHARQILVLQAAAVVRHLDEDAIGIALPCASTILISPRAPSPAHDAASDLPSRRAAIAASAF